MGCESIATAGRTPLALYEPRDGTLPMLPGEHESDWLEMTPSARRRVFLLVLAASILIALWSTAASASEPGLGTAMVSWLSV